MKREILKLNPRKAARTASMILSAIIAVTGSAYSLNCPAAPEGTKQFMELNNSTDTDLTIPE